MDVSPDLVARGLTLIEQIGPTAAIAVGMTGVVIWMMVRMLRQFFGILPQVLPKLQELITAVNGVRSDVRDALRELESYRQGQRWRDRYGVRPDEHTNREDP